MYSKYCPLIRTKHVFSIPTQVRAGKGSLGMRLPQAPARALDLVPVAHDIHIYGPERWSFLGSHPPVDYAWPTTMIRKKDDIWHSIIIIDFKIKKF